MSETFDTLTAARKLEAAGMERKLAEAIASVISESQGELAMRGDLAALRSDFATLRWMVGANVAASLAILAVALALVFQP